MLGYEPDELDGSDEIWLDLAHPEDRERMRGILDGCRTGLRDAFSAEFRVRCKDGRWLTVAAQGQVLHRDASGSPLRFIGNIRETTTQNGLDRPEHRWRLILDSVPALVAYLDISGRYRFVNRNYERWFGLRPEELEGRHPSEALGEQAWEQVKSYVDRALAGEEVVFELTLPYRFGIARRVHATYTPDRDENGQVRGFVGLITDIDTVKRAEEAERRYELLAVNSRDIILFIRLSDGRILEANAAAVKAYGYSRDELLGLTVFDIRSDAATGLPLAQMADADVHSLVFEAEHRRKDGATFPVEVSSQGANLGTQRVLISVIRDITLRKAAEQQLRRSEALYRTVARSIPGGAMLVVDPELRFIVAEGPLIARLGLTRAGLEGIRLDKLTTEEARVPMERFRRALGGEQSSYETEFRGLVLRAQYVPLRDDNDNVVAAMALTLDVSEDRRAQEQIAQVMQRLRAHMDGSPLALIEVDPQFLVTRWSEQAEDLFGWTPQEVLGKSVLDGPWVHPEDAAAVRRDSEAMLSGQLKRSVTPLRNVRKDGSLIHCEWYNSAIHDAQGQLVSVMSLVLDVTQRQAAESALREREEQHRLALDAADLGTWRLDAVTGLAQYDERSQRFYGFDKPVVSLNEVFEHVHPEDRDRIRNGVHAGLQPDGIERPQPASFRVIHSDGTVRWLKAQVMVRFEGEGPERRAVQAFGTTEDITERRRAEEALRDSEHWLRESQRISRIGSYVLDLRTMQWTSSETLDELFGIDEAYVRDVGGWLGIVHPEFRAEMSEYFQNFVLKQQNPFNREYMIARASDGEERWVLGRGALVRDNEGNVLRMAGTIQDITDRKQMEGQLQQAMKMESVGRLAGGVAHDFNNLLTVINGYSELLMSRLPHDNPLRGSASEIRRAGERAASLTQQLLAFSRRQMMLPRIMDLNATVAETERMLRRLIGEDIRLETRLAHGLGCVKGDPGQINQVLLNLAVNARDAMPNGGCLRLETMNADVLEGSAEARAGVIPGQYVRLIVTDSGSGMDETTLQHLFEPFYTTKPQGLGTGLGLSTVYGIVKQSGGQIRVESERGQGTAFIIDLPRVDDEIASPVRLSETVRTAGSGTILLVEDQEDVRALTALMLREFGYRVLDAGSGDEAIALSQSFQENIDLLLTDVVMPGLAGRTLVDEMKVRRPGIAVLYMSGYTDDVILHHGILEEGVLFVQKPFSPQTLAGKVREALDSR